MLPSHRTHDRHPKGDRAHRTGCHHVPQRYRVCRRQAEQRFDRAAFVRQPAVFRLIMTDLPHHDRRPASKIRSQTPPANEAVITSCARMQVSDRSRQGAPERKTQKMPLRMRRSSTLTIPRGLFGSNGLMTLHSWSQQETGISEITR